MKQCNIHSFKGLLIYYGIELHNPNREMILLRFRRNFLCDFDLYHKIFNLYYIVIAA